MRINKRIVAGLLFGLFLASAPSYALAQSMEFFRIGTGGAGGTYYPIGGLVAQAISNPPGSRPCAQGGSCGVPGLIVVPQSSNGSVSNVKDVDAGRLESGFAQSDIVYWAYTGTGVFEGAAPVTSLRAISNLYPESIHLVARPGLGIKSVADLKGKRVSLDESGSGTLEDARIILNAYGLSEANLTVEYIKPDLAASMMAAGDLDAYFIVAGYPVSSVVDLASKGSAELVAIDGLEANEVLRQYGFFAQDEIPAGTYANNPAIKTLSVGAQWIVGKSVDKNLVYEITKAIWNRESRKLLDNGHPKGEVIIIDRALDGIGIPLHSGAERFYREVGMVK